MSSLPTPADRKVLQKLEEDLWREETRFDLPYMERILAADFIEIGRSGRVYSRTDTLSLPRQPIDAELPLPDFNIRLLSDDIAQVTYNSRVTYEGTVQLGRRSSIWVRHQQIWILKFHQGTPYEVDG
jgi:hypothetical protein